MLQTKNLTKVYKTHRKPIFALRDINFTLNPGDHLAVIGPNGSGKTTLIKLLTQISHPTEGEILINNRTLAPNDKNLFGLMLGASMIYRRLTVRQTLLYYAALYNLVNPVDRIKKLAKELDFADQLDTLTEALSEGFQTKVAFARAILHCPEILILDEPTNTIDPISADHLKDQIKQYPTVIFSSHNLYEVIDIAQQVLILNKGRQVFFGPMKTFKKTRDMKKVRELLMEKYL